jgi:septum formation protein
MTGRMATSLWRAEQALILASKSEARCAMLVAAGLPVEIEPAAIDERAVERSAGTEDPQKVAILLAREKARAVASRHPGRCVVGADQTLALGSRRFSKPVDRAGARDQLAMLRGHTHALHSGVALVRDDKVLFEHGEVARLTMRDFSDSFLDAYLDAAGTSVTTSVGAYQLEKIGVQLFSRIEGDHFTILGLPLLALLAALREQGLLAG